MATRPPVPRRLLAALIILSAILFAIGSAVERHESHKKESAESTSPQLSRESGGEARSESGETAAPSEGGVKRGGESSEDIFGINPEATGLVIAAIAAAALLALTVWVLDPWLVLAAVIAFGLVFAAFDVREIVHQVDESRESLVVIASVLAATHLSVALIAAFGLRFEVRSSH